MVALSPWPPSLGSPESAHSAGVAPCLAVSLCPVHSTVASASWTPLEWKEAGLRADGGRGTPVLGLDSGLYFLSPSQDATAGQIV